MTEMQQLLAEAGLFEDEAEVSDSESIDWQRWLVEAGLDEDAAESLALSLEEVESPEWMEELSLKELFALASGEEIDFEDENED